MGDPDWQALLWPGPVMMLLGGVLAMMVARFLVPRLPEPEPDPGDPFVKPLYSSLVRPGVMIPSILCGMVAGLLSPLSGGLMWAALALAGIGGALVCVDAATTYLPAPIHWLCTIAVVLLGVIGVVTMDDRERWAWIALGAIFGAAAAYAVFWLVWRVGEGFGYGDVRLAALVGGFSGAMGVQSWWTSLFAAATIGALAALVVAWWRRRRPSPLGTAFPYGPALWAGPFLALLL